MPNPDRDENLRLVRSALLDAGDAGMAMDEDAWFTMVEIEINSHCNRRCAY